MRFICTEFDSNTNNLYRKEPIDQSVIADNNQLLTKSHKIDTKDGVTYAYIADTLREVLFSQFIYDGTARTPSAWLTAKGLPGTDHTSLTGTFDFQNASVADIKCSYFFTIIAEDGLRFALPRRISTSKEIKSFNVISELKNYEDDFSFQGETGKIYTIGESPGDTVKAITIDSTLKSHRINKYKSLQNVLTIQSGSDASPLYYVLHNGSYYILVSRTEVKSDLYIYTCVKEVNEAYSFSGNSVSNYTQARQLLIVNETQTSGTHGGTFTSGAYRTRTLNTVIVNSISGASLASNQITLPIGKYKIKASAPAYVVQAHKVILYNVTDATTTCIGGIAYSNNTGIMTHALLMSEFEISSTKVFELKHQSAATYATYGFGAACSFGDSEVYSVVEIDKIG